MPPVSAQSRNCARAGGALGNLSAAAHECLMDYGQEIAETKKIAGSGKIASIR